MKAYWTSACVVLGAMLSTSATANSGPDYPIFGDINDDCVVDMADMKRIDRLIGTKIKFDKGDLNNNGGIDVGDYFFVNVSYGSTCGKRLVGDVDGSGLVDSTDLGIVLGDVGTSETVSDINGDGKVTDADLDLLEANWGATLGRRLLGDVNGDNVVSIQDLSEVLSEWGKGASPADMNGDNVVNAFELDVVRSRMGATAGQQVFGDVNGNFIVDHIDGLLVRGAIGTNLAQFDLDGDGKVTQTDYDFALASKGQSASDELTGDVNGDWVVDDRDVDTVQAAWGTDYAQTDIDGDGTTDIVDLNILLGEFSNTHGRDRTGDIDGNGLINDDDLAILEAAWGTGFEPADLNDDGTVDAKDLGIFLAAPLIRCGTPDKGKIAKTASSAKAKSKKKKGSFNTAASAK